MAHKQFFACNWITKSDGYHLVQRRKVTEFLLGSRQSDLETLQLPSVAHCEL